MFPCRADGNPSIAFDLDCTTAFHSFLKLSKTDKSEESIATCAFEGMECLHCHTMFCHSRSAER